MHAQISEARKIMLNTQLPMKQRMRALFFLRNSDLDAAISALCDAFNDKSVLLKHEAAYVLGQMRNDHCVEKLIEILENENEDEIVRHEAGEALGNFLESAKKTKILDVLVKYLHHSSKPISETCYLALKKHNKSINCEKENPSIFGSIDPALIDPQITMANAENLFLNSQCMYERYQAMFFLRDQNTIEAVEILKNGFNDVSALFKHEIAFVFGQMRNKHSAKYLHSVLEDVTQHGMVRHEAAEALGAIGAIESAYILQKYIKDPLDVVRESVEVALDIHEYENSNNHEYVAF